MASSHGNPTLQLIESLARLTPSQLAVFITLRSELAPVFIKALHSVAVTKVSLPILSFHDGLADENQIAISIVSILAKLIERGDPSLARKLVPSSGCILDLALASHDIAPTLLTNILSRLLDPVSTEQILQALIDQFQSILTSDIDIANRYASFRTLARFLAAFLSACPSSIVKGLDKVLTSCAETLFRIYDSVLPSLTEQAEKATLDPHTLDQLTLDPSDWHLDWLTTKVELLQATSSLIRLCSSAKITWLSSTSLETILQNGIASLDQSHTIPLVNASLIMDLCGAFPTPPPIATISLLLNHPSWISCTLKDSKSREAFSSQFSGPAWKLLERYIASINRKRSDLSSTNLDPQQVLGKGSYESTWSDELVATVDSILPHFGLSKLRTILCRPSFRGLSAEETIQRLLEGDDQEYDVEKEPTPARLPLVDSANQPRLQPNPRSESTDLPLLRSRANVFDSFAIDLSKATSAKSSHPSKIGGLSSELKAAIIARAEHESDDDDDDQEEWNPFTEHSTCRTVGVEDELDLDYEGQEIIPSSSRSRYDSDNDNDEREMTTTSGAEQERAAQRTLIKHYVTFGFLAFEKDSKTRTSDQRSLLKRDLNQLGGTRWDDALVESWAIMFERNPKKDRLLSVAAANEVEETLVVGGSSSYRFRQQTGQEKEQQEGYENKKGFGPDRGRGGRVLGGSHRGRGGGGRGASTRGGGGGGGTGHNGNDRTAKMKEKRGNQARKRGFDNKVAKGAAGASI